jgi:hypothetical protein
MWPVALLAGGAALAYASTRGPRNNTQVRSRRDGNVYSVQDLPDKQEAADKMAEIHENLVKLIDNYKSDPASMADPRVKVMIERFDPENMVENDVNDDSTSYSENKGQKIVICLREKSEGYPFVDNNTIMFVILHEMAHLMTTTIGHTPEFWANFRRILQDAVKVGIYQPVNYAHSPTPYCGMTITDSPL